MQTLHGKVRRYRIYCAATGNKPYKGYEYMLWIQRRWSEFAMLKGATADLDAGLPWVTRLGRATGLSSDEIQTKFDDWNEAEFGILPEETIRG